MMMKDTMEMAIRVGIINSRRLPIYASTFPPSVEVEVGSGATPWAV